MTLFTNTILDTVGNIKLVDKIRNGNNFSALVELMDSNDVKYTPTANRCESVVGDVKFFLRTYSGNKIVLNKEKNFLFSQEIKNIPDGITLNDYILISARNLMYSIYSDSSLLIADIGAKIALSTFPVPFGIYYDKKQDVNVALIQMCVDSAQLTGFLSTDYNYVSVEDTGLLDFLSANISDVTFRYTSI